MFFLNLTAGEFFALLGALGGLVTALYLLDRAKRKKIVSTLRFWTSAVAAEEKQTRKRMRDPWSLILQLVSLCLLLLAIAQLQWGTRESKGRDHVLLLDTSAWSAEVQGNTVLLDREKQLALAYVARLPVRDRVMLVLADALTTPVTPFTADRAQLSAALREARPGFSSLNIEQALSYARQAQDWSGAQPGEIVYIGPKEIGSEASSVRSLSNLRLLAVPLNRENAGILRMAVKRSEGAAGEWQASITVKNYGLERRTVRLNTRFGATVFAPRALTLGPHQETAVEYVFVTNSAGRLLAHLDPPDVLSIDNSAALALPRNGLLRVAVYTSRAEALRPLLAANPRLSAIFYTPSQYQPNPPADVMLLDGVSTKQPPAIASLWIQPARDASPLPVKSSAENALITNWNTATPLGNGLHGKETHLPVAEVFHVFDGDVVVGSIADGPLVVARPATSVHPKIAVIGFDPLQGEMKFEVTTPLLFANLFDWLTPQPLRALELSAARVGAATVTLDPNEHADQIRVNTQDGRAVPFTLHDQTLQLFTAQPDIMRIGSADRERVLSLTLPDVADHDWQPPASLAGLPAASHWISNSITLWQWLAVLGGIGLLAEWLLFGWRRVVTFRKASHSQARRGAPAANEVRATEVVSR